MSVPKANPDPIPKANSDSAGKRVAGAAVKGAAVSGANSAGTAAAVGAATKGVAALGGHAVSGVAGVLSNIGNAVGNVVGSAVHAVTNAVSTMVSGVTNFFGGVASAASSTFAGIATAITVGASAVLGVGIATDQNNVAVISDPTLTNECATNHSSGDGGSDSGSGTNLGTEEQQKNAYIIYTTMYQWFTDNGQSNAENQAYGFLANVYRECGYNPASLEGGKVIESTDYATLSGQWNGLGLVQWTSKYHKEHGVPQSEWPCALIASYFESNSMPWDSLQSQLVLLISGNDPFYPAMVDYINNSGSMSAAECNIEFLTKYEKPAKKYLNQRTAEAADDIAKVKLDVSHYISTADDEGMITDILTYGADITTGTGDGAGASTYESNVNCYEIGKYDNSSIANAAVSFAWKTEAESKNDGTAMYIRVYNAIHGDDGYYKACDRCVSAAVAWSGSDDAIADCGGVDGIKSHFDSSDRWEAVGKVQFDADGMPSNCEPGDVLLVTAAERGKKHGHVVVYVGNETIKQFYPDADDTSNMVSASLGDRSAACGTFKKSTDHEKYTIYRCVNPENSTTYTNAGN